MLFGAAQSEKLRFEEGKRLGTTYDEIYKRSIESPEAFWSDAAADIDWYETWHTVLDKTEPPHFRWFCGGKLNTCYNCLDRHVAVGRGNQVAIIYDSPVTGSKCNISYRDLLDQVSRFAGALAAKGVGHGDRVIIYMPMVPEAVVAALACARLGAIHSIVFGGFAPNELAIRIGDCLPKAIVSASCGIEPNRVVFYKPLLDEAIELSGHTPDVCVVLQRPERKANLVAGRDITWADAMVTAEPHDCVPVNATDPLYILYTSGTTGQPKGVVRDNGGHAVALKWSMKNIYAVDPGEVFWAASDIGWVVGHSYIIYGPLLQGCTTVLFEGKPIGTPDAGAFWRVIADYNVAVMFTAPTAIRAIRQQDPEGLHIDRYDLTAFRSLFLAGERCDPDTLYWLQNALRIPVIDHWWQTETGWAIAATCLGFEHLPVVPGSAGRACPGWDIHILDGTGNDVPPGENGAICAKLPLPPSSFPTLWNADERYRKSYFNKFPGYYESGDAGMKDDNGNLFVMARTDDVINVAGHRLSTGAIEEVLATHPAVAECAVVAAKDTLKGQLPVGLLVLNAGYEGSLDEVTRECITLVRDRIGPVAAFKTAVVVHRLPKTRSGKILRGTMRRIVNGEEYTTPATIEEPAVLNEIADSLSAVGYSKE